MKNSVRCISGIMAALVLLTAPMALFAEGTGIGSKILSIGPRATYSSPKDSDNGAWFGGVQGRLHVSPALGLEGSVDYRSNDFGELTTVRSYPILASVLAYVMPGASWSPFLLGGGGWYYTETRGPRGYSHNGSRFGLHAGAGIEIMVNESLSVDGSYRYVWLESVSSRDESALDKSFDDSGSMVTMALNFLF